jgi:drug/metabolite transporter (DMT)-like permease
MTTSARHLLHIHVAVLLFGLAGLFGKFLSLPPAAIVFWRVALAALALLVAGLIRRNLLRRVSGIELLAFVLLGVLLAVHWTTFFQSVRISSVAVALITYSTFPVFTAFLEPLCFRERLHIVDIVRAAAALAGVAILTPSWNWGDRVVQGVLWGVASGATFALLSLLNRKLVGRHGSWTLVLYQDLFAAAALLPFVVPDAINISFTDALLLLVLGIPCTALSHALFVSGLQGVSTRTASVIACLEPVYGTLLAVVLLDDIPSLRTIVGGAIVLGVALHATVRPST